MKTMLITFLAIFAANQAFAADQRIQLQDGFYRSSPEGGCSDKVVSESNGDLTLVQYCGSGSFNYKYQSLGLDQYQWVSTTIVTASILRSCIPTTDDRFPCGEQNYDSRSGRLLLKVGDVETESEILTVISGTAFRTRDLTQVKRDGSIVSSAQGNEDLSVRFE